MAWRRASGPQRTPDTDMVQNFSQKAYHPAVQARVAQLDQANPVAGSTSQRITEQQRWRGTPLARINTASVGHFGAPAYAHSA